MTDLHKILYGDAKWVFSALAIKNLKLKNRRRYTTAILKTFKSPYLCNRSTDEIWHIDEYYSSEPDLQLVLIFENLIWWTAAVLKIKKTA